MSADNVTLMVPRKRIRVHVELRTTHDQSLVHSTIESWSPDTAITQVSFHLEETWMDPHAMQELQVTVPAEGLEEDQVETEPAVSPTHPVDSGVEDVAPALETS